MNYTNFLASMAVVIMGLGCTAPSEPAATTDWADHYQVYDTAAMESLFYRDAPIAKISGDFKFTEGPAWNDRDAYLVFSDIPQNRIYQYDPMTGISVYRDSSGLTQNFESFQGAGYGSNGLAYDPLYRLHICQHGNRQLVREEPDGTLTVLASHYRDKRLNSPNDLTFHANGDIYFTDPPYGLPGQDESEMKELSFNGIYLLNPEGRVLLLDSSFTRPNGIGLSPDGSRLYVANSDGAHRAWYHFDVDGMTGQISNKTLLHDATDVDADGSPDGLKVTQDGHIFATGPGGVWVFTPDHRLAGKIIVPEVPANLTIGGTKGKTLFLTARTGLYKLEIK